MYFYKQKGKQMLDMRGDLVLSHNDALVKGRVKSAAPAAVRNSKRIENIPKLSFWGKIRATKAAISFIWGPSQALSKETIEKEGL